MKSMATHIHWSVDDEGKEGNAILNTSNKTEAKTAGWITRTKERQSKAVLCRVLHHGDGPEGGMWFEEGEVGMEKSSSKQSKSPSQLIDARIDELGDWRGSMLSRLRTLVQEVDPDVVEEWKWRGVPVWYDEGMICTGETYKAIVKITFAKGAALEDPAGLFNSSLDGTTRRAIDFHEGEKINVRAFKALVRAAVVLNKSKVKR